MNMDKEELDRILAAHKRWVESNCCDGCKADLSGAGLRGADLSRADLRGADLRRADLSHAILRGADLRRADLSHAILRDAISSDADLRGADLSRADLRDADLSYADLSYADLSHADLRDADLSGAGLRGAILRVADLRGADLDFSCWPLWCGSLSVKIDKRIAAQLLYHALRAMRSCANDEDVAAVLASPACVKLANRFHRADECGKIEKPGAATATPHGGTKA